MLPEILEDVSLASFTTLGVGGAARFFVRAESEEQMLAAFDYAGAERLSVFVLGGGSNILVSDEGFDGLVIQVGLKGIETRGGGDAVAVKAAAGEDWDEFVERCVSEGLSGVECLSGIPGLVGGTPIQNVGAYGQEVSETIVSVRCYDRISGEIVELSNRDCGFAYRSSIFNTTQRSRYAVLGVTYALRRCDEPKIAYKDLKDLFSGGQPTLREAREGVLNVRRRKSMVIDANDPNSRSAGSFFKNPIIGRDELPRIAKAAGEESAPNFPVDEAHVKVPAAWLIEQAGFGRGYVMGRAGISENHSLAIINRGGATAGEIIELKNAIQRGVAGKFGIELKPEPIFIGF